MSSVRLEGISRRFNNVTAIEDIEFSIPDGEFWVLVGPSGCGKSTILRAIAGLESASCGNIYIDNIRVNDLPARQRDVAMVFQNYALYPHMSVADNLGFGLKMRRTDAKTMRERIEWVARSLDLTHLLDRKPKQLSGGQQQRVALGRAIAREPKVFLLDEPLSNLDAQLRDETRAQLKQLHQRLGITTIYVTHDRVEAMTLADRMVVLDRGRIQQIGAPESVYRHPANRMVATFLGSPPMNILPAVYNGDRFEVVGQLLPPLPELEAQLNPTPGQGLDLGIRLEHLHAIGEGETPDLTVEVTLVEPLGRETLIRAIVPSQPPPESPEPVVNLQTPPDAGVRLGDRLPLQFQRDRVFAFDPTTGETLYRPDF